jgi:hypothetical protein
VIVYAFKIVNFSFYYGVYSVIIDIYSSITLTGRIRAMKNRKIGSGSRFIAIESISLYFNGRSSFRARTTEKLFTFTWANLIGFCPVFDETRFVRKSSLRHGTTSNVFLLFLFFLNEKLKNGAEKIGITTYVGGWGVWRKNKGV